MIIIRYHPRVKRIRESSVREIWLPLENIFFIILNLCRPTCVFDQTSLCSKKEDKGPFADYRDTELQVVVTPFTPPTDISLGGNNTTGLL